MHADRRPSEDTLNLLNAVICEIEANSTKKSNLTNEQNPNPWVLPRIKTYYDVKMREEAGQEKRKTKRKRTITKRAGPTRTGITNRIREYFLANPNSFAKQCCRDLNISHEKYHQMCWNIKSQVKKEGV